MRDKINPLRMRIARIRELDCRGLLPLRRWWKVIQKGELLIIPLVVCDNQKPYVNKPKRSRERTGEPAALYCCSIMLRARQLLLQYNAGRLKWISQWCNSAQCKYTVKLDGSFISECIRDWIIKLHEVPTSQQFGTCINGTGHECWSFKYHFWFLYEGSLHVVVVVITLEA